MNNELIELWYYEQRGRRRRRSELGRVGWPAEVDLVHLCIQYTAVLETTGTIWK